MEEKLKIRENHKIITCGIILINKNGDILAGHPTGRSFTKGNYDLLKGCSNEGEDDLETAIREMQEECGLDVSSFKSKIIDLGIYNYLKNKDIHLFLLKFTKNINLKDLHCTSYFVDNQGISKPEMNGYKLIKRKERDFFMPSLQKILEKLNI